MKNVIIFGNSNFARLIKWYLINDGHLNVIAFTVDDEYVQSDSFEGVPLIPFSKLLKNYSQSDCCLSICIGYSNMNKYRSLVYKKCKELGYEILTYIHSSATVSTNAIIGDGNIILERTVIQPFTKIGNCNILWSNVNISHDDTIGDYNFFAPSTSVAGFVRIGNNCFFGNNCTIRNEISISDFTLVGAATYINASTTPNSVYRHNGKIFHIDDTKSVKF